MYIYHLDLCRNNGSFGHAEITLGHVDITYVDITFGDM